MLTKALEEDPNVFDYDAAFETDKAAEQAAQRTAQRSAAAVVKQPRYIASILEQAQQRKREQELIMERRLVRGGWVVVVAKLVLDAGRCCNATPATPTDPKPAPTTPLPTPPTTPTPTAPMPMPTAPPPPAAQGASEGGPPLPERGEVCDRRLQEEAGGGQAVGRAAAQAVRGCVWLRVWSGAGPCGVVGRTIKLLCAL